MSFADVSGVRVSLKPLLLRVVLFAASFASIVWACQAQIVRRESGPELGRQIQFNIPAQPLREALFAYTKATGLGVLIDDDMTSGRRSAMVQGSLPPELALKALLAGTGLDYQYIATAAFTLVPAPVVPERDASRDESYFRSIQSIVKSTLCSRSLTLPGGYRVVVQLWINMSGVVLRSALLASTGNAVRDRMLSQMLDGLPLGVAPPAGLPQPVTLIILPRAPDVTQDCGPSDYGVTRVRG
jgi:hypothetical protein